MIKPLLILLLIVFYGCSGEEKNKKALSKHQEVSTTKKDETSKYKEERYALMKKKMDIKRKNIGKYLVNGNWVLRVVKFMRAGKHSYIYPHDSLFSYDLNYEIPNLNFLNDTICVLDSRDTLDYQLALPYLIFKRNLHSIYPIIGRHFEIRVCIENRLIINSDLYDRDQKEIGGITYYFFNENNTLNNH